MAKSKNFVREIIIDAGPNGTGDITVGGAVSKYNKTFDEAGFQVGDKGTCVIIDDTHTSYELLQVELIAPGKLKRNKLLEQKKDGVFVPEPKTPLALTEAAYIYLTVTAEEVQEVILAAAIAAEGDASATAVSASEAAGYALAAGNSAESAKTSASSADKYATDMENIKVAGQKTIASLKAQEDAVVATIGGGWGAITHKLKASNSIKAVCLGNLSNDTDYGLSRSRDGSQSWYRETLNTAWRGSRGPRPKVAPMVLEASNLTVHDGTISDPEMWMEFNNGAAQNILARTATLAGVAHSCCDFLDGILYVGNNGANGSGLYILDFVKDEACTIYTYNSAVYAGGISQRNEGAGFVLDSNLPVIVHEKVNAVAATVLPGAELDADRGLPCQTVAVATDGGISVINPTGSLAGKNQVSHITGQVTAVKQVCFTEDGKLAASGKYTNQVQVFDIPETDILETAYSEQYKYVTTPPIKGGPGASNDRVVGLVGAQGNALALATADDNENGGFTALFRDPSNPDSGMAFHLTENYASGCMLGNTTFSIFADTAQGTVSGNELATNGGLDAWTADSPDNWDVSAQDASNYITEVGGAAHFVAVDKTLGMSQDMGLVAGRDYLISFDFTVSVGSMKLSSSTAGDVDLGTYHSNGTYQVQFTAKSSWIYIWRNAAVSDFTIDNISVREVIPDRSGKGNHAQIIGSLNKAAVNTDSELVGWSGWSPNDYAEMANNDGLDIDTGDFLLKGWINTSAGGDQYIFQRDATTDHGIRVNSADGKLQVFSGTVTPKSNIAVNDGIWRQLLWVRKAGISTLWLDAVAQESIADNTDWSLGSGISRIGCRAIAADQPFGGSLALLSFSNTAPTEDQISLMYRLERAMFQPGGTASLGVSAPVTSIDYDWSNNRAYVGTAGGGTVVIDLKTMQRLEIISSAGYPDFTSDNVVEVSAAQGGWLIGTDQEAVFYDPPIAIRERG